jgi:hypothetical protein
MNYSLVLPDGTVIISPETGHALVAPMGGVVLDFDAPAPPAPDADDWFIVIM